VPSTYTEKELLQQLQYQDPIDNEVKSVVGFDTFLLAAGYTDSQYSIFKASLLGSLSEITDEDLHPLVKDALLQTLEVADGARIGRGRYRKFPMAHSQSVEHIDPKALRVSRALEQTTRSQFFGGGTWIGPVFLGEGTSISEVQISEEYDARSLKTLRGVADPVLRTHKNKIVLSLTVQFSPTTINSVLRPLMATLRAAPVVEIKSDSIVPVFVNSVLTPETVKEIRQTALSKVRTSSSRTLQQETKSVLDLKGLAQAERLEQFKEFVGSMDPVIDYILDAHQDIQNTKTTKSIGDSLDITKVATSHREQKGPPRISVSCAFIGALLFVIPEKVNTLGLKLTFTRYNDTAWQEGSIVYRNKVGLPTTDVLQCPWIERLAESMFLNESQRDNKYSVHYMEPYAPVPAGRAPISFLWEDPFDYTTQSYIPNPRYFIIDDVQIRASMKMVSLPLAGQVYPVVQYLGAENMVATIEATVSDRLELAKLHEMKAELDAINYDAGPAYRKSSVNVTNNVINLMGAKDFQITRIETRIDNSSNVHKVQIQMVESRISIEEIEAITLVNGSKSIIQDAHRVWDYIYDAARGNVAPGNEGDIDVARDLLFGRERDGVSTFLEPGAIRATVYSLMKKREEGKDKVFIWNTDARHSKTIQATFSGFFSEHGGRGTPIGLLPTNHTGNPYGLVILEEGAEDALGRATLISLGTDTRRRALSRDLGLIVSENRETSEDFLGRMADYIDGAFFTRTFWDEYFDVVVNSGKSDYGEMKKWKNADLDRARNSLMALISVGIFQDFLGLSNESFPSFNEAPGEVIVSLAGSRIEKGERFNPRISNYADLRLPTYGKFFSTELTTGAERPIMVKDSGSDNYIELWRRFAPTYSDLGKRPPFDLVTALGSEYEASQIIARGINDPVEPDIPYYHKKLKEVDAVSTTEDMQKLTRGLQTDKKNSIKIPEQYANQGKGGILEFLNELKKDYSEIGAPEAQGPEREDDRRKVRGLLDKEGRNTKSYSVIDREGQILGVVYADKGYSQLKFDPVSHTERASVNPETNTIWEPWNPDYIVRSHKEMFTRLPDRNLSLKRMFPAYRLYFIEEDKEQAYFIDDLYGANCVISLSLRKSKDEADVLTFQISNITDNFGYEETISQSTAEELGLIKDEEGERYFGKLKLRAGVNVQLKLGYGTLPSDLEIEFTGMITEIHPGKIITVVAQGHKRELLNEVQFDSGSSNFFEIAEEILKRTEHPHLGRKYRRNAIGDKTLSRISGSGANFGGRFSGLSAYIDKLTGGRVSSVMENVWLEANGRADAWYRWNRWVVPPQPAWEALKELVRHAPGHIIDVVPRGTEATLFIGMPDQPYRSSFSSPNESLLYDRISSLTLSREQGIVLDELLDPFLKQDNLRFRQYKEDLKKTTRKGASDDLVHPLWAHTLIARHVTNSAVLWGELFGFESPVDLLRVEAIELVQPSESRMPPLLPHQDLREAWNYFYNMSPEVMLSLIAWYFNIDLAKVATHPLRSQWTRLEGMFYDYQNAVYEGFYQDLDDSSVLGLASLETDKVTSARLHPFRDKMQPNPFGFPMSEILKSPDIDLYDRADDSFSLEERSLNARVEAGILTPAERDLALSRLRETLEHDFWGGIVPRSQGGDPMAEELAPSKIGDDTFAEVLIAKGGAFKSFIFWLYQHHKNAASKPDLDRIAKASDKLHLASIPPGFEIFRNHHRISNHEIIENNIYASMAEMANCVLIRAPSGTVSYESKEGTESEITGEKEDTIIIQYEDTAWTSFPTNDGISFNNKISRRNRKLAVMAEINALDDHQKLSTLMSNMGIVLQPMYRGELIVVGRNIRPYDVIYLHDEDKDVRGHIEVESVTHHFSAETGWVTVITPHALVNVNNPTSNTQMALAQTILGVTDTVADVLGAGILVVMALELVGAPFTAGQSLHALPGTVALGRGLGIFAKEGVKRVAGFFAKEAGASAARQAIKTGLSRVTSVLGKNVFKGKSTGAASWAIARHMFGVTGSRLFIGAGLGHLVAQMGTILTSTYMKHQIASTRLPVDMHVLYYRGQPFTAGLEADIEDQYSIWEKFRGSLGDMNEEVREAVNTVWRDIFRDNYDPVEKYREGK